MPVIEVPADLDSTPSASDPISEELVEVQVEKAEQKPAAKEGGGMVLHVQLRVMGPESCAGRVLMDFQSLSKAAAGFLKDALTVLGVPWSVNPDTGSTTFDTEDMLGKRAKVQLRIEEYKDQKRNRVVRYLPSEM